MIKQSPVIINEPVPTRRQKTIAVSCHEEAMEIVIMAELFATGLPVYANELWLGSASMLSKVSGASCHALQSGESQFTIFAYFKDCGTKLSITDDSLVYSNVLMYTPFPSPDGVLHSDGAAIPVQCQYRRWYNADSAAVAPTWIPFSSSVTAEDVLEFQLRLMSDDWQYERGSNVYFLGGAIHLQASVTLANHLPLLLFADQCVATPTPNVDGSDLQYSFIDYHGCLSDSMQSSSHSKFLQRIQGNRLQMLLDAFKFHRVAGNLVYITCYLKAIPAAYSVNSQNRACSFIDNRWQSVDGDHQVCDSCEPSKQGIVKPEPIQSSRITLAAPIRNPTSNVGRADFFNVRPGQSLQPIKALIQARQPAFPGLSKRGTDSKKDWQKIATLGPLVFLPKQQKMTTIPTGSLLRPAKVSTASFTAEPELFNLTEITPVSDEFETTEETQSFSPLDEGFFLDASDGLDFEEGSGFQ
ncbi:zona pellucida sperm-binding protein 3b [Xyrauchen texanus]|uniref:zona pellucida sperm-binding protein 3b n=1 Tax=Xyrauchen texanus TaxID=154827 RepID=UPI002241C50F|nr:zona pellucida sperm-binding protein 3b [Xyrauchen texanus]